MTGRTVLLRPWQLARTCGKREGRAGIPEDRLGPAPGLALVADLGRAELAEQGQAWWGQAADLESACHTAAHACERAALDTDAARRAAVPGHPDRGVLVGGGGEHGHQRRGLSTRSYCLIVIALAVGEAYFSYISLLALGEDRLRWAGVVTLGVALLVLARALGTGWRDLHEEPAPGLTRPALAVIAVAALGLILAQAALRAQAVSVLVGAITLGENLGGSASPPTIQVAPWWVYAMLQCAIFLAAAWASWAHANPAADRAEELAATERAEQQRLQAALDAEQAATDKLSTARTAWAAAFAARGMAAERVRWLNAAAQDRYWHFNLLARRKADQPLVRPETITISDSGWRSSLATTAWVGEDGFPTTNPVWSRFTNATHTNGQALPARPAWTTARPEVGA